nr:beta-galactosidase [Paenibacillus silvisoli]
MVPISGFYNGANCLGKYESTVTSYDYDVLLNESGDITDKYISVRNVLARYTPRRTATDLKHLQPRSTVLAWRSR